MSSRVPSLVALAALSALVTAAGVAVALQLELALLAVTRPPADLVAVGLVEEALVRLLPLILTFYAWSYVRGELLSKEAGLLATAVSGVTVAGLELWVKLEYLAQLEAAARFDALVLPILFVHLPLALLAGRFAYALGERIHGTEAIGWPAPSARVLLLLVAGYLLLALAHLAYNVSV